MAGIQPLILVLFERGGRERDRRPPFLLLTAVDKPVGDTSVGDLCVSQLLEMGEDMFSFFLLGRVVCVMKIVCSMGRGDLLILAQKRDGSSPLRKAVPARENLNWGFFSVFEPAADCWSFPMAGGELRRPTGFPLLYIASLV